MLIAKKEHLVRPIKIGNDFLPVYAMATAKVSDIPNSKPNLNVEGSFALSLSATRNFFIAAVR
jgi:hypothetical protein